MNRIHSSRRNNYQNHRSYKPSPPKEPFQEIPGAAFFLGKLNKHHDREHIYNELKKLTRVYNFYIRKLDMPYADKVRRTGNMGYAFVHTRSAQEAKRIVSMKTLKLGHQVCEVKVYGGRNEDSSTSEAFSGRTTPEMSCEQSTAGFVNPLKAEAEPVKQVTVWGKAKIVDIVRPRIDSGCQTRNVSECEEKEASLEKNIVNNADAEKNLYDHDHQIPVSQVLPEPLSADSEIQSQETAYLNNTASQRQLEADLALVRNHVGDSEEGVQLFMTLCDKLFYVLLNTPADVVQRTAQIGQIQV